MTARIDLVVPETTAVIIGMRHTPDGFRCFNACGHACRYSPAEEDTEAHNGLCCRCIKDWKADGSRAHQRPCAVCREAAP